MFSMDKWIGKVAVVTGASVGIGKVICEKLVDAGVVVVGMARRTQPIEEHAKELQGKPGKLYAVKCDITKESDVKNAFWEVKKIGPIHILINNAGLMQKTSIFDGDVDKWRTILETNVLGTCIATKEAISDMRENRVSGQIINMNSILGHFVYNIPQGNIYPASKHAVTAMTEALRLELIDIDSDIKVTSISPGPVGDTEFFAKDQLDTEHLKNFLKPEHIAETVMFVLKTPTEMQGCGREQESHVTLLRQTHKKVTCVTDPYDLNGDDRFILIDYGSVKKWSYEELILQIAILMENGFDELSFLK